MKKNTAILLGALLLPVTSLSAFAQSTGTDEGRPHLSNAPSAELTRMCRAEAKSKNLAGKERSRFLRDCQSNKVPPEGSAGASSSSSSVQSAPGAQPDAEGRTQGNVNTSRISKKPPTTSGAASATTSGSDAEGRPKAK
jgi:hypothetical protein